MHTLEVDGVPVFWAPAPGPLTAGLLFGCGTRDETFVTIGVTHLIEHLVMSTLPKLHHEHNAYVDLTTTGFHATGRPEQVVAYLRAICEGIARLPVQRLAQEAGVLAAEEGFAVHPTAAPLLTRRYGTRDVGLETFTGPGPTAISVDAVMAHLGRHFVAGNAALWLSGPPPPELRLPLPSGPRVVRTEPTPLPQDGPRWSEEPVLSSGMLLRGQAGAALSVASAILMERLTDEARHRQGLSYEVFGDKILIGPTTREHLFGANAREGRDAEVAEILWREASALAAAGPTAEELAHQKQGAAEDFRDERWPAQEAATAAGTGLFGIEYVAMADRLAEIEALTTDDVRESLAAVLDTALIAVPLDVKPSLPGVAEGGCPRRRARPTGEEFTMKALVRLFAWQWRPPRYYLTGDGLARLDPDGDLHTTTFADIVGIQATDDMRLVFTANGCLFPIPVGAYRGGEQLIHAVETAVAPGLRFGADGQPPVPVEAPNAGTARARRILNAVGAVAFALAGVALLLDSRANGRSIWWPVAAGLLALWCAWDARPRRRRRA